MNRKQEHDILKQDLTSTPPELEDVLARAQARAKRRKTVRNCLVMPASTIAALFILFVGMVNLSPTMASAMEQIPGLRGLTIAVSFSPSLTEAVERDFVQTMDLEQTIGTVTMRIEHLVVDNQQLHIFYTLDSPTYFRMDTNTVARCVEAEMRGRGWATLFMKPQLIYENGAIRHLIVGFDEQVPTVVLWEGSLIDMTASCDQCCVVIGDFSFTFELDSEFVGQGELMTLGYDFVLDGQRLTLSTVELNPIQTRVTFAADEENTAWLRALGFHLENERGQRFDSSAILENLGTAGGMMTESRFLESAFFAESENLTMVIEEVTWLDKAMAYVRVDLVNGTAKSLPENLYFMGAEQTGTGWILTFRLWEDGGYQNYQITYERTPEGGETVFDDTPGLFFYGGQALARYDETVLYLPLRYTRVVRLETPIVIRIK